MTVFSLLYTSRNIIPLDEAEARVEALVEVSQSRNASAGVTGCLIFSGDAFAQILEGDQTAVEGIMRSIHRDQRHTDVAVLRQGEVAGRRFQDWALGYAGPSRYVQRTIARATAQAPSDPVAGISDLLRFMTAFRLEASKGAAARVRP